MMHGKAPTSPRFKYGTLHRWFLSSNLFRLLWCHSQISLIIQFIFIWLLFNKVYQINWLVFFISVVVKLIESLFFACLKSFGQIGKLKLVLRNDCRLTILNWYNWLTQSHQLKTKSKADDLVFIKIAMSNHPHPHPNQESFKIPR